MKNPFPHDGENLGYHEIYEQARQDAIKVVTEIRNPNEEFIQVGARRARTYAFEEARKTILAALESEDNKPVTKLSWGKW